jgi:hypothetical protein
MAAYMPRHNLVGILFLIGLGLLLGAEDRAGLPSA